MSSEVGGADRRPATKLLAAPANGTTRPCEPENLPCPRCDSTNTKFCYYNNYNLSQPRHFCKSCRRYWTRGGTLRNIPVGGGTRKNSSSSHKRARFRSAQVQEQPENATPISCVSGSGQEFGSVHETGPGQVSGSGLMMGCGVNLNECVQEANGTFTSLLTGQMGGGGLMPLGGFGLGLGGFGLGHLDWPMVEQVVSGGHGGDGNGNDKWQLSSGDDDEGCFGNWPDLAISAPGTSLK